MNPLSLHIDACEKSFGIRKILKEVSFSLAQGEIIGLFGRNGSGKSTLLHLLFGTLKADRLELRLRDQKIHAKDIIPKQYVAFLPQESLLPQRMLVRDMIPVWYPEGADQDRIFRAPFIERIAARRIGTLSMGERRYFELQLVANLHHPFLLLDEPFSMIEPLYATAIKEFLTSLKAKKGILITDHYYRDVLEVADRGFVLHDGAIHAAHNEAALQTYGYLKANEAPKN